MDVNKAAKELWHEQLLPMGVRLIEKALIDISTGIIIRRPQDNRYSTFEPSMDVKDIFFFECLMVFNYQLIIV